MSLRAEATAATYYLVSLNGDAIHKRTLREVALMRPEELANYSTHRCPIAATLNMIARLQARGLVSPAPNAPELP